MKFPQLLLTCIIAIAASLGTYYLLPSRNTSTATQQTESVYDRVMRTNTLNCGYAVYAPYLVKDANTQQLSGIYYDYIEALAKSLSLKVNWVEEVGYGDMPAALNANRFDAFCNFTWPTAARARSIDFSQPIFFDYLQILARPDDTRFDNNLSVINDAKIIISVWEGTTPEKMARLDFPVAHILAVSDQIAVTQQFLNVVEGKADIVIAPAVVVQEYLKNNPGKLAVVKLDRPYHMYGNAFAFKQGEDKLRRMIDIATTDMFWNGGIDKILAKYEDQPGLFLHLATPYRN